jgi:hypothetical protein
VSRDDLLGAAAERGRASEKFICHDPERVDVAPVIDGTSGHLLRRHVGGRTDHHAGAGHRLIGVDVGGEGASDAEVGEEGVPAGQQHVVRLHVTMDDARLVRVSQRVSHFAENAGGLLNRQPPEPAKPGAKRLAVHERHDVERHSIRGAGIEERQDMRVAKVGGGPDLGNEALGADDRGQVRLEHLDRDIAVMSDVVREIDRRHPADTELPLDAIVRQEGSRERRRDALHAGNRNSPVTDAGHSCDRGALRGAMLRPATTTPHDRTVGREPWLARIVFRIVNH